jgi:hypothetical protein
MSRLRMAFTAGLLTASAIWALPLTLDVEQTTWLAGNSGAENATASLPIDIGEASSAELPLTDAPEVPPVIGTDRLQRQRGAADQ